MQQRTIDDILNPRTEEQNGKSVRLDADATGVIAQQSRLKVATKNGTMKLESDGQIVSRLVKEHPVLRAEVRRLRDRVKELEAQVTEFQDELRMWEEEAEKKRKSA